MRRILVNTAFAFALGCVAAGSAAGASLGEYSTGTLFRTSQAVAVIDTDGGQAGRRLALVPLSPRGIGDSMLLGVDPKVVEQLCNDGKCRPNEEHLVAVLPVGTVLRVTEIRHFRGFSFWGGRNDEFVVFATSSSALLDPAKAVDMTDLSVWKCSRKCGKSRNEIPFLPNPRVLAPLREERDGGP